jgi:hypothetical protein
MHLANATTKVCDRFLTRPQSTSHLSDTMCLEEHLLSDPKSTTSHFRETFIEAKLQSLMTPVSIRSFRQLSHASFNRHIVCGYQGVSQRE